MEHKSLSELFVERTKVDDPEVEVMYTISILPAPHLRIYKAAYHDNRIDHNLKMGFYTE